MAEFTFDGWDACEPSYSQFPIYLANLQSQVAVGTFVEFATKVYRIVSHEDGLTMRLNYFQPFEDAALPHPCISVGNGCYVRELVQTTTGLNVQNSDQFRVVFLHTEEYITNGEYILGDGVECLSCDSKALARV